MPEKERIGRGPKKQEVLDLEKRLQILEVSVKALILAMKQVEIEVDEYCMPKGEYYGHQFE